uniref:Ribosome maturation protein SDO1/SBDS N-terminal domain-containing protein n=1 Tax=Lotharella oceanica TaxID=641309 RepID=A0A7S2XB95_9EUKA
MDLDDALEVDEVFYDAHKFAKCSSSDLAAAFGTSDPLECAETILKKGTFSLSSAEKKEKLNAQTDAVVSELVRNYKSIITNQSPSRNQVQDAIKAAKVKIEAEKPVHLQVDEIVDRISESIKLVRHETDYTMRWDAKYGSVLSIIKRHAKVKGISKSAEGKFTAEVGIPPSEYDMLIKDLRKPTNGGDYEIELIEQASKGIEDVKYPRIVSNFGVAPGNEKKKGKGKKHRETKSAAK